LVCVAVSLLCAIVGAAMAGAAAMRLKAHQERTQDLAEKLVDQQRLQKNLAQINASADRSPELSARAQAAVESIKTSLAELRLPKAMLALRAARVAVRLLFSGR